MVKLFYLAVLYKRENGSVISLRAASDLTSFGFFQRSSAAEFMRFTSKTVVERAEIATRCSVNQQEYICHAYLRADRLCGVLISDQEYPNRVAHTLLSKVLDEFTEKVPPTQWPTCHENHAPFTKLEAFLAKFQNPKEADAITKLNCDIDETKIIIHNTILDILQRGEKLDNLISKSEDLSVQSKMFYKTAKSTNSCCNLY